MQRHTKFIDQALQDRFCSSIPRRRACTPIASATPSCARTGRDTYRTFLLREIPGGARNPETRRATVPIRALFGVGDAAVHRSFVAAETANADDYTLETVDASHFIIDERPDLVRAKLIALAEKTRH